MSAPDLTKTREKLDAIDRQMAALYEQRMALMKDVARFKHEHGMAIVDAKREKAVIKQGCARLQDPALKDYYKAFQTFVMEQGKDIQQEIIKNCDA